MSGAKHFWVGHGQPADLPSYYDVETVHSSPRPLSRSMMQGEIITSDGIQIVRALNIPSATFSNIPARSRESGGRRYMLAIASQPQVVVTPTTRVRWHRPHDLIVLDTSQSWEVRVSRTKMSTVMTVADDLLHQVIDRDALRQSLGRTGPFRSTTLMSAAMDAAWTVSKAGRLADAAPRVLRSLADLLWLATAAGRDDERAEGSLGLEVRREQFKVCVEQRYADPDVTSGDLARELRISTRYLRRAFAEIHSTPARYLHDFRLDASAAYLVDPAWAARTVTEVALRCGFNSAAHFSTEFKRRFGRSPREFRMTALRADHTA